MRGRGGEGREKGGGGGVVSKVRAHIYEVVDLQGNVIVTEPTDLPLPEVIQGGEVDGVCENF